MANAVQAVKQTHTWQNGDPGRVDLGRFSRTGPLAWGLSRLAGALTGGGRVRAIEAIGLTPGMLKFSGIFIAYVNSFSRLRRADSELVILRTAWNCGCYYEWFQHVYTSGAAGLAVEDVARIGRGPEAPGWTAAQQVLLAAVDELTSPARFISDDTWARLQEHFDNRQVVDVCLLTGCYAMLAMLLKSVGAEPENGAWQRRPLARLRQGTDTGRVLMYEPANWRPSADTPPVPARPNGDGSGDVLAALAASPHFRSSPNREPGAALGTVGPLTWALSRAGGLITGGGRVAAADAIGNDPRMMRHYLPFALKLVLGSHLSRTDTELATLRITWNSGMKYEWHYHAHLCRLSGISPQTVERVAAGPSAPGWNERQRALLTAVDELSADRIISEDTWSALRTHYDERQLAALCLLVGHYDMIGMLFNSFGVEPEPGALQSGPLAILRRADDTDRLMPSRLPLLNKAFTNRLAAPFAGRVPLLGTVRHAGRRTGTGYRTPVLALRDGRTVVIPLAYGDRVDWVRNVLAAGTAELDYLGQTCTLAHPRVLDRADCDDLGLPGRIASRVVKVFVADCAETS